MGGDNVLAEEILQSSHPLLHHAEALGVLRALASSTCITSAWYAAT